ncbi:unnamed protein product [Brassica rapa subsp. narinosa]
MEEYILRKTMLIFECCLNGDGLQVATGSYRRQVTTPARPSRPSLSSTTRVARRGAETPGSDKNGNTFDHTTKLLPLAWHPTENLIASAAAKSLYM